MFQIFKSVLLLSCVGAALTSVLLLAKPLTSKHFSSSWQYYIWLIVLVSMILPVRFSKKHVNVDLSQEKTMYTAEPQTGAVSEPLPEVDIPDGVAVPVAEIEEIGFDFSVYDAVPIIWLLGTAVFMVCALISYWRFLFAKRKCSVITEGCEEFYRIKDKLGIKHRIVLKRSDDVSAPMLTGVFKPVIYIPENKIGNGELEMIFMHELTHYKRRDLWYKWFSLIVNALHWFNPFVYIAVKSINEACELSCDERVTKDMTDGEKKTYMNTIVGLIKKGDKKNV